MDNSQNKASTIIDTVCNSAISFEAANAPGEGIDMVTVGSSLFIVGDKDIYVFIDADKIDPKRTNPRVPNVQQKVCDYGKKDNILGATLLTAERLIQPVYLREIDHAQTMQLVFNCTQELIGLRSIAEKLQAEIEKALAGLNTDRANFIVPHTKNLVSDLRTYFEKTKQLFNQWCKIIKVFFPDAKGCYPDKLLHHLETVFTGDHPFKEFLKHVQQDFEFVLNCRNAVVHPETGLNELQVFDYTLKPDHTLLKPVFGLVYPNVDFKIWDVISFVSEMTLALIDYTEQLIGFSACYSPYAKDSGGFPKGIAFLPVERQHNNVRLTYIITINGEERILG
jgi:hypothetical protein